MFPKTCQQSLNVQRKTEGDTNLCVSKASVNISHVPDEQDEVTRSHANTYCHPISLLSHELSPHQSYLLPNTK